MWEPFCLSNRGTAVATKESERLYSIVCDYYHRFWGGGSLSLSGFIVAQACCSSKPSWCCYVCLRLQTFTVRDTGDIFREGYGQGFPSANERKRLPTPTKHRLAYTPPQRISLWACKETTPSHLKLASCGESSFRSFFFAGALSPRDRVAPLQRTSPIGALDEGGGLGGPFRRRQAWHGITSIRPSVRWFRPNRQFFPDPFHSTPIPFHWRQRAREKGETPFRPTAETVARQRRGKRGPTHVAAAV